jgi:hypothetical protein
VAVADRPSRLEGADAMMTPKIHALGITPEGSATRWQATGDVDGVGWLEAWGPSLIAALAAWQARAAPRVTEPGTGEAPRDEAAP